MSRWSARALPGIACALARQTVALLLGVVTRQVGKLDAEAARVDRQPLIVGLRELHHEVVWHQRPALRDNGGTVIHLALHRTGEKARVLGWKPKIQFEGLVEEMVLADCGTPVSVARAKAI